MSDTELNLVLAGAHTNARQADEDLQDAFADLPAGVPLLAVADMVSARAHLVSAQRLIEAAATRVLYASQ